ncbi:hypothetical protein IWQ62_002401 [Dispira parvispora]|uniref:DAGKc domain-containing protein n=1 Tax=Dispira parvispora TaxID=1520584 RepID=A0A9W8AVS7_9FUNG|nr:hypothetical protein IWQ62_002401 [Dispira parvispora]
MASSSSPQIARHVLVLLNPNAGVYRAASVHEWSRQLVTFWAQHTVAQPQVTITQSYTQVRQTLREWLPVSNSPVWSGNALATALDLGTAEQAMLRYTNPQVVNEPVCRPLRTMQVTLPPAATLRSDTPSSDMESDPFQQNTVQSFCVVSWGFHCNNVSSSEWLRFLGPSRFLLAGLKNLVLLRDYYGHVDLGCAKRFQPSDQADTPLSGEFVPLTPESGLNTVTLEGPFTVFLAAKQAVLSDNFCITPFAKPDDAFIDVIIGRGLTRRQTMEIFQGAASQGRHVLLPFVEYYKVQCLTITPRNSPEGQVDPSAHHEFCIDGEIVQVKEPGHVRVEVDTSERTLIQTIS